MKIPFLLEFGHFLEGGKFSPSKKLLEKVPQRC